MKKIVLSLFSIFVVAAFCLSCQKSNDLEISKQTDEEEVVPPDNSGSISQRNNFAIWIRQSDLEKVDFDMLQSVGINNVIIHEYIFDKSKHSESAALNFLTQAHLHNMKVHIWIQCFWHGEWVSPVIDPSGNNPAHYDTDLFQEIINSGISYLDSYGEYIDGIHFDYIRFGGTAHKHDFPQYGITGSGAITEFCKQASEALKKKKENLILSAAIMGEYPLDAYGQDITAMSEYIDIFMPMAYIASYGYSDDYNVNLAKTFKGKAGDKQIWYGISTYDKNENGLDSTQLFHDCENIYQYSNVNGLALFRYGLGQIPDLSHLSPIPIIRPQLVTATISDFISTFSEVVDVWETNTADGSNFGSSSNEVHYIPNDFTLSVKNFTCTKSDLYDIAIQTLNKLMDGGSLTDGLPQSHKYEWSANPYLETASNGGAFATENVGLDFILNYCGRQQGFAANNDQWANFCNYTDAYGNPVNKGTPSVEPGKYKGCCCLERSFLILARLFKYIDDNQITADFSDALKNVEVSSALY